MRDPIPLHDSTAIDAAIESPRGRADGQTDERTDEYRRIVAAVRSTESGGGAPDHILQRLLERQAAVASAATPAAPPVRRRARWSESGRLAPLSAALALALAMFTTGLPTLLNPTPESLTWVRQATEIPTAPLGGRFEAASPELEATPSELDTTQFVPPEPPD